MTCPRSHLKCMLQQGMDPGQNVSKSVICLPKEATFTLWFWRSRILPGLTTTGHAAPHEDVPGGIWGPDLASPEWERIPEPGKQAECFLSP